MFLSRHCSVYSSLIPSRVAWEELQGVSMFRIQAVYVLHDCQQCCGISEVNFPFGCEICSFGVWIDLPFMCLCQPFCSSRSVQLDVQLEQLRTAQQKSAAFAEEIKSLQGNDHCRRCSLLGDS